jgi:hypothetical protein
VLTAAAAPLSCHGWQLSLVVGRSDAPTPCLRFEQLDQVVLTQRLGGGRCQPVRLVRELRIERLLDLGVGPGLASARAFAS